MRGISLILSVALLASACATRPPPAPQYTWHNPDKTRQQFAADRAQCNAMAGPGSTGLGYAPAPSPMAPVFGPYNRYANAAQNQRLQADARMTSIFNDCMEGQGWQLRVVQQPRS